jgi:N-acetylglucosaminyl-diphospho-decaprenol L-rhamnosyltransferase
MPGPESQSGLSVVIVTYNSAPVLPGLLDSLPAGLEGIGNFEVIVVDNASSDNSVEAALAHPVRPTVIKMGRNAGYAAGINAAAAAFRLNSDILILNPDLRLMPGAARLLVERLADASVGVAVPNLLYEDGSLRLSLRREPSLVTVWSDAILGSTLAARLGAGEVVTDAALYENGGLVDWATGAALAVAARTRYSVGEWDESFFLYSEEVDYLRRVRESGLSIAFIPQAKAMHIGGEYHANSRLSALMTANRIRYFRRYHGLVSTAIFRLGIVLASAARFVLGPGHRAALRAALTPWRPPPESRPIPGVQPVILNGR